MLDIKSQMGRKLFGLVVAILLYYIVHEGAHLIFAVATGSFDKIVFMLPGIQIKIFDEMLTTNELAAFSAVGAISSLTVAYVLTAISKISDKISSNTIRAGLFYVTVLFLLNDPIYLSLLCDLFGGGDMNGIALVISPIFARIAFGVIAVFNVFLICKFVLPRYKNAFLVHNKQ